MNNPIFFVDIEGKAPCPNGDCGSVIAVFYDGGPFGCGKTTNVDAAGGTGEHYENARFNTNMTPSAFKGRIIAPGLTSASGVENGLEFIKDNYTEGDQVIIYGYSYGVDVAVDLTEKLNDLDIPVDLLITVDGSDGPMQNATVTTTIPENVSLNLNIFQNASSGTSIASSGSGSGTLSSSASSGESFSLAASGSDSIIGSSSGTSSGSSGSSSPSSNSPGSNGGPNQARNPNKTTVMNRNLSAPDVTHGNIQQKARSIIKQTLVEGIFNYNQN
ncbi:MAG: hypothetical protein R3D00_02860 [Bacteroidia bacterium]